MLGQQAILHSQSDTHDVFTGIPGFVVLYIPYFGSSNNRLRNGNRSYLYMTCSSEEPKFTLLKSMRLPDMILSCGSALIACTLGETILEPQEVLLQLILRGYGRVKWAHYIYSEAELKTFVRPQSIKDAREVCPANISDGIRVTKSEARIWDLHPTSIHGAKWRERQGYMGCDTQSATSTSNEMDFHAESTRSSFGNQTRLKSKGSDASFATAGSHTTFFSATSSLSSFVHNSAASKRMSSTRLETIRQDEPPEPGLPAQLAQVHKDYYATLHRQEIIKPFDEELNWSGKGQHVTFTALEAVPLSFLSHLGSSNTAIVEQVLCLRIALARKTMRCSRKWDVSKAMREVSHLQRLPHFHIVQLVGTYLQGRNFSILMYPVAEMHLGTFLEDTNDLKVTESVQERRFLGLALGCLASAVAYIHQQTTKHMDIKPQNVLVRQVSFGLNPEWQIYLADFGLSRSFASQDHSQTDGPTARSPRYCSPEVYDEAPRGRPSDIFSLGCVFLEMLCVMGCLDLQGLADARRGGEHDESFHANLESVTEWILKKLFKVSRDLVHYSIMLLVIRMLCREPSGRPTAADIRKCLEEYGGRSPEEDCCSRPPEPYTAYQPAGKPK